MRHSALAAKQHNGHRLGHCRVLSVTVLLVKPSAFVQKSDYCDVITVHTLRTSLQLPAWLSQSDPLLKSREVLGSYMIQHTGNRARVQLLHMEQK